VTAKWTAWLTGLAVAACSGRGEFRPLQVGDAVPDYSATTIQGDTITLHGLQGRPVLLNVWATWCIPCRKEMPALQDLYSAFADSGLNVVAVSVDEAGADADVRQFVEAHGIRFIVTRDPDKAVSRAFRTVGVPETFLVDRRGRITRRWIGEFDPASEATRLAVRQALGG
jgi:peroxiredoxin